MDNNRDNNRPKPKVTYILQIMFKENWWCVTYWTSVKEFDTLQDAEKQLYSHQDMINRKIKEQRIVKQETVMYVDKDGNTTLYYD